MKDRFEIIRELKKYFEIRELVGPETYKRHENRSWKFFSTDILLALLIIRENLNLPITINTWHRGGRFTQRGLRSNIQNMFRQLTKSGKLYLSGHVLGEAFDFDVQGLDAMYVRLWIERHEHLFPMHIRLEDFKNGQPISWVHLDTIQEEQNPKVYRFNV